jgi:hypothetical protein
VLEVLDRADDGRVAFEGVAPAREAGFLVAELKRPEAGMVVVAQPEALPVLPVPP